MKCDGTDIYTATNALRRPFHLVIRLVFSPRLGYWCFIRLMWV